MAETPGPLNPFLYRRSANVGQAKYLTEDRTSDLNHMLEVAIEQTQRQGVTDDCACGELHSLGQHSHGTLIECRCGLDWVVVDHDEKTLEPFDELAVLTKDSF